MYNRFFKKISHIKIFGHKIPIQTTTHRRPKKYNSLIEQGSFTVCSFMYSNCKPSLDVMLSGKNLGLCDATLNTETSGSTRNRPGAMDSPQWAPLCSVVAESKPLLPSSHYWPSLDRLRVMMPLPPFPSFQPERQTGTSFDGSHLSHSESLLFRCLFRRWSCGHDNSGHCFGGTRSCSLLKMGSRNSLNAHLFANRECWSADCKWAPQLRTNSKGKTKKPGMTSGLP